MKNIRDELYYEDLAYKIKSFAEIDHEYNAETEKRIDQRMYATDKEIFMDKKYPEWAVLNSYFWEDLVKFCIDVGQIVDFPECFFHDLKKYKDVVCDELNKLEYIVNEKDIEVENIKK